MTTTNGISEIGFWILTWVFLMPVAGAGEEIPQSPYNVRAFGTRGDGTAKDTPAVQAAIDTCEKAGGGTVYFPAGTYLCGSLHLRSGVTLWLDSGATLRASADDADFDPCEDLGFENDSDDETSYFSTDTRHAFVCEDVADLRVDSLQVERVEDAASVVLLENVRGAMIQSCKPAQGTSLFLEVSGAESGEISLLGNDLNGVGQRFLLRPGVDQEAVRSKFNL